MKDELMEILVCPVCKGDLELTVTERDEVEIVTGSLYCKRCDFAYPITETIPNLLPPDMQRQGV
ncbi:MAG: Trm112 family protein [Dehalococcoidia bacterium]|jgi:uncharacterized protein YbaR (Trm112 family)|nr:Trm112 family protein [Dehalococcoidia bacterium]